MLQNNGASVGFAVAGGIFLLLGNMSTQYSLVSLLKFCASPLITLTHVYRCVMLPDVFVECYKMLGKGTLYDMLCLLVLVQHTFSL